MKIFGSFPSTRLRRVRSSDWIRRLVSENYLSVDDLIMPIFIKEGKNSKEPIKTMPGIFRYTLDQVERVIDQALELKIPMVALFPNTPKNKKNSRGSEALNKNNLICKALKLINKKKRNIGLMTDIALDPYTSHGHDGIIKNNYVDNDETVKILKKQAILQAQMGSDIIAPSDMMDGRIGIIRNALDSKKFKDTGC